MNLYSFMCSFSRCSENTGVDRERRSGEEHIPRQVVLRRDHGRRSVADLSDERQSIPRVERPCPFKAVSKTSAANGSRAMAVKKAHGLRLHYMLSERGRVSN